jgi:hypothetical protein
MGNGDRYVIDLAGRTMRKFVVSGTPTPPNPQGEGKSEQGERPSALSPPDLSAITVVQMRVESWAWQLYNELQALYDINPDYFQNVEVTVPMGNEHIGVNPYTSNHFSPFDIWFYGPGNQEWSTFSNRLRDIIASPTWSRDVMGEVFATAFFSILQRINSAGLQLGPYGGGSLGWNPAGPWTVNFCHAGYCLKVRIKADGTFEFLSATDEAGNQVPPLFGAGWAGSYQLPVSDPAFERLRERLEGRGIPVSGNSCSGWLMLICTYVNGVLNSCYTQIQCD